MEGIKVNDFPKLLKNVHNAQKKWRPKNYMNSIAEFHDEIEEILEILNFYGKWNNKFQEVKIAEKMIPEIFMDGLNSLYFALLGLYKYANMCLRSQLETALRFIYFIDHKKEYEWWLSGNVWYKKSKQAYVWGDDFSYFENIDIISKFDKGCEGGKKIYSSSGSGKSGDLMKEIYSKLSKSIHTSATHFQTSTGKFSPKYSKRGMNDWIKLCKDLQCYIIISLILSFPSEFNKMSKKDINTILEKSISDNDYIREIKSLI
jgi:hypothetical protein